MSNYLSLLTKLSLPARKPRISASVVPWRRTAEGEIEVYWVRRSPKLRFMGGFHAFPGGGLSKEDSEVPVNGLPQGLEPGQVTEAEASPTPDAPPDLVDGLIVAALRELFEETGLLLVDSLPAREILERDRERLLAEEVPFGQLLDELGAELQAERLVFAGRWLTPPFVPMRFDNRFFLLEWPVDERQQPEIWPGELDHGEWIRPVDALERWEEGGILTAPPILHKLRCFRDEAPEAALPRLLDTREACFGPLRRVEFLPGIHLFPLKTPTLLPATHTNAFLLGHRQAVLVDPATPHEAEQDRLIAALHDARESAGITLQALWLTHHHPDHIGAVERLRREFDVPVLAHADAIPHLQRHGIALDDTLEDGQVIELEGPPTLRLRVVHTPGHASGHLAFFDEHTRALVIGDLISSLSTIVVAPPDGNMDDYLRSIDKSLALEPSTLFPAHGPLVRDAAGKLEEFRTHRLEREAAILAAYRAGQTTPEAMVATVYPEVPEAVHPVACWQIAAHLERLEKLGEIP